MKSNNLPINSNLQINNVNTIFNTDSNGNLTGGGFKINNLKLPLVNEKKGNINLDEKEIGKIFENLVIPFGLYYENDLLQQNEEKYNTSNDNVINEQLFNNLLHLAGPYKKKNVDIKTRKKKSKKSTTRKAKI